jgi:hypothetical protein
MMRIGISVLVCLILSACDNPLPDNVKLERSKKCTDAGLIPVVQFGEVYCRFPNTSK